MLIKMPVLFCVLLVVLNHMIGPINTCAPCPLSQPPSSFRTDYDSDDETGQEGSEEGDGKQGSNGGGSGNGGGGGGGSGGHGGGQQTQPVTPQKPAYCKFDLSRNTQQPTIKEPTSPSMKEGTKLTAHCPKKSHILIPYDDSASKSIIADCDKIKTDAVEEAKCLPSGTWSKPIEKYRCVDIGCLKLLEQSPSAPTSWKYDVDPIICIEDPNTGEVKVQQKRAKLTVSCELPKAASPSNAADYFAFFEPNSLNAVISTRKQTYKCDQSATGEWLQDTNATPSPDLGVPAIKTAICSPTGCPMADFADVKKSNYDCNAANNCDDGTKTYLGGDGKKYLPVRGQLTDFKCKNGNANAPDRITCNHVQDSVGTWSPILKDPAKCQ